MTSNDLRKLRTLFLNEVKRREKINTLLNNYAKLTDKQRDDLIWYSEVLIDKKV